MAEDDIKQPEQPEAVNDEPETPNPDPVNPNEEPEPSEPEEALHDAGFDASEITRKLDALSEAVGVISKAIAQLVSGGGQSISTDEPAPEDTPDPHEGVKDFDELDL